MGAYQLSVINSGRSNAIIAESGQYRVLRDTCNGVTLAEVDFRHGLKPEDLLEIARDALLKSGGNSDAIRHVECALLSMKASAETGTG